MFLVRGCRPGKTVQMSEAEVRGLCLKSREIFLQQPILLDLEAPLKICGKFLHFVKFKKLLYIFFYLIYQEIYMDSTLIYCVYLSMVAFLQKQTIYFWVIMLIVGNSPWKLFVFY